MFKEDTLKPLGGQCTKCLKQKVQCICHTMFKVGDWIRIKGTLESDIFKLTENEIKYKEIILGHFIFEENTWTHWQPAEGEWCWMWNDGFDKPYLEKLMKIDKNGKFYAKSVGDRFKHCEPFIGELPSFIKDKQ